MKRTHATNLMAGVIAFVLLGVMTIIAAPVMAADVLLNSEIEQVQIKTDKNGAEYAMFIIKQDRELNGIQYTTDAVVMAFGTTVEQAKQMQAGQILKAIAATNEYQGRTNYNILSFVN